VKLKKFCKYIETFYLGDYVNDDGEIMPLFEKHFSRAIPGPQTEAELNEYLQNVIYKIKSRGQKMVDILRERTGKK
jgi:hypothetical protein